MVVASVLTPNRVAALKPGLAVAHPHAARLLAVVERLDPVEIPDGDETASDAQVVVAEHLEGRSLQQRLDAGPLSVENAVEWVASIADALGALHATGAVHGAISPRAILVIRPEPAVIPVLTHLLVPPSGAYCSPERVTGAGPSEADDAWALAATLYTALARRPPFQGGTRTELARAIVAATPRPLEDVDDDLWAIVARGLAHEPTERYASVRALRDVLHEWTEMTGRHSVGDFAPVAALVGVTEEPPNVGDLSLVAALAMPESPEAMAPLDVPRYSGRPSLDPDAHSDPRELAPAPAPTVAQPAPETKTSSGISSASPVVASRPADGGRKTGVVVAIAVGAALAAGAALFVSQQRQPAVAAAPSAATVATNVVGPAESALAPPVSVVVPSESAVAPSDSVAPAESAVAPMDSAVAPTDSAVAAPLDVNACAAATLPQKTLGDAPSIGFLCTGTDVWGLTRKVDQQVLKHGSGDGLSLWAHLGRFDLAAVALLRERCCPGAAPFTAATPKGMCETLGASTTALASAPSAENADHYAADVECYVSKGIRYPAEWWDRITAKDARGYFDQYVAALGANH